jgi:hypothetical protein
VLGDALSFVGHVVVARDDLPIPEWLFAWGAAAVLIVTFYVLSAAWHESRFEEAQWHPIRGVLGSIFTNRLTEVLAGAVGVFLLWLVIWSGLRGTEAPDRNFSLTFVFITVWVGMVFVSAVFGDVFRAFNPWRAIARAVGGLFKLVARQSPPPPMTYPERLGRWPAVAGVLAFAWLELVYAQTGFQAVGLTPNTVAIAVLVYTAYTFVAMTLFGSEKWLERGEFFSVFFGMFATLSPFEARDRRLGARRALSATTKWVPEAKGSLALVLVAIGATTFDGASEGVLFDPINSVADWFSAAGPVWSARISNTLFLAISVGFIFGLFWAGIYGMHTVRSSESTRSLGHAFAHAFIPIALAYFVAHYFSVLFFLEQAQFTFLLSDPLGDGSNIFGTAGSGIDYSSLGSETIWYIQVAALVLGHAIALVLGHDRAIKIYGDSRVAARSQYWMLALMVGFTSLGLFLLTQANQ